MKRPVHRVSVKAALLNPAGTKVLMTRLHDGGFGLPGGHMEYNETPEQTITRELQEELGLENAGALHRCDFWRDTRTDRLLLGFVGTLDESSVITVDTDEMTGVIWASLDDFITGKVHTETYEGFIRQVLRRNSQENS
jgi:8-oxo-dGTP pyrophosphatase MutT (NUDIX family)